MVLIAYRLAWTFALPLVRAMAAVERAVHALTRRRLWPAPWRLSERLAVGLPGTHDGSTITSSSSWLHAASLGECKGLWAFAQTLRRALDSQGSHAPILLTTNTTTGLDFLRREIADIPDPVRRNAFVARLAPLDHPRLARRFLRAHGVRALVLFEVELWPHWIAAARRAGIPVLWISARLTPRARRRYAGNPLFAGALRRVLQGIEWIQTQTEDEEHALRRLGAAHAETGGDLRGLHALNRMRASGAPESRDDLGESARQGTAFVSIHARELPEVIAQIQEVTTATPEPVFIFPRKLHEIPVFVRLLGPHGFVLHSQEPLAQASVPASIPAPASRVIVDAYGLVDETLARVRTAVIGGSFGTDSRIGGHNVWEPLLAGCGIVIGPYCHNQRALVNRLRSCGLIRIGREEEAQQNDWEIRRAFIADESARLDAAARHACDAVLKHHF